jgi:cytochrome P450
MILQLLSNERGNFGSLWKYFPRNKRFEASLKYLNDFCMKILAERRQVPTSELALRTDLLSKMLVTKKVRCVCHCRSGLIET